MPIRVDPEGVEIAALRRVADWRGSEVIEIGCGDGRLTRRLARLGAHIVAIDPSRPSLETARKTLPPTYADRVRFSVGSAESLKFRPESFDIAVLAWSL